MDLETGAPFKAAFTKIDKKWGQPEIWRTIYKYSPVYTDGYFLNAVDMQKGPEGTEARPENQQIYLMLFKRTLFMSVVITLSCILLAYPLRGFWQTCALEQPNLLMILVLLPFGHRCLYAHPLGKSCCSNKG